MKQIRDYNEVSPLVMKYFRRGVITNNFLGAQDYRCEIDEGRLFFTQNEDSLCFFIKRDGFFKLYFHALDQNAVFERIGEKTVCETVANGDGLMIFNGFSPIMQRVRLEKAPDSAKAEPCIAEKVDAKEIHRLLLSCFDAETGCIPTLTRIELDCERERIFKVTADGKIAGIVRTDTSGGTVTIRHLCVGQDLRGKGIARRLCSMVGDEKRKVSVWTGKDNAPALNLYGSLGFSESGILSTVYERT